MNFKREKKEEEEGKKDTIFLFICFTSVCPVNMANILIIFVLQLQEIHTRHWRKLPYCKKLVLSMIL